MFWCLRVHTWTRSSTTRWLTCTFLKCVISSSRYSCWPWIGDVQSLSRSVWLKCVGYLVNQSVWYASIRLWKIRPKFPPIIPIPCITSLLNGVLMHDTFYYPLHALSHKCLQELNCSWIVTNRNQVVIDFLHNLWWLNVLLFAAFSPYILMRWRIHLFWSKYGHLYTQKSNTIQCNTVLTNTGVLCGVVGYEVWGNSCLLIKRSFSFHFCVNR